ncbi:MAG: hypothetical protein H7210_12155 [Pyrinomonadaceae bacterium]|nr:hypothetical protein [Phycisphaerales bacterium]
MPPPAQALRSAGCGVPALNSTGGLAQAASTPTTRRSKQRRVVAPGRSLVHLIVVLLPLAGCASNESKSPGADAASDATMVTPSKPCPVAQLADLKAQSVLFRSSDADSSRQLRITIRPLDAAGGWVVTREVFEPVRGDASEGKIVSWREQTLIALEDGSVALKREINKDDAVIVDFDPPMVVYPATLPSSAGDAPGFTQTFHVTVHPMKDERKIKVQGPGTQEITYVGDAPGTLDGKSVTTAHVRSVFVSDFGGPKSRNETSQWLAPGQGLVKESRRETTKLLGVQIRENKEAWILPSFLLR